MGAMGMALISMDKSTGASTLSSLEKLDNFTYEQKNARCGLCSNNCALIINKFPDGSRYITGNRCERGQGVKENHTFADYNMYKFKNNLLFNRPSLDEKDARFGTVGLPRVLNMYEDYPFWHSFFTSLGFKVILSRQSDRDLYEKGISSISSETACYPAKLAHGHIEDLIEKNPDLIFYPAIFFELKQFKKAQNHMNCPVVSGYPDVIKNNVENLEGHNFMNPYLSFESEKIIRNRLIEEFEGYEHKGNVISKKEIKNAVKKAWDAKADYHKQIKDRGKQIIDYVNSKNINAIVLAGRPYHVDPEINHGIPELIEGMRIPVLSEDAIAYNLEDIDSKVRVLDQWSYHARLYRASEYVAGNENLQLIQLNSFGCGLDAVTTDQVQDLLEANGKIYTLLKIDEVSNLGAVKIRIRSLLQALNQKKMMGITFSKDPSRLDYNTPEFSKKMIEEGYTILAPQMAREHFRLMKPVFHSYGYNLEFLDTVDDKVIDHGLKYVNNDSCYPSITAVGQLLEAVNSGRYDKDKLALLMTQTGGACRASNYVGYIRKGLKDQGLTNIPVIALSAQGIETNAGFNLRKPSTLPMLTKAIRALMLGDLINRVSNRTRPYELVKGSINDLKESWIKKCEQMAPDMDARSYEKVVIDIVRDFDNVEISNVKKPKAGIVGEILVKFLPEANNHLQDVLEAEGAEVIVPDLTDFLMYCLKNSKLKADLYGKSKLKASFSNIGIKLIEDFRKPVRNALANSQRFEQPLYIEEVVEYAKEVTSLGNQAGEGWLLAGEMVELIKQGAPNIVCIQPFGCLPNHITGKGVMKKIRQNYEQANIVAIDYDPGASEVNQINRVKLMMSKAREALKESENIIK